MFFLVLLRVLIFAGIIYLVYKAFKYVLNPKRKLELALENKQFYFYDTPDNVRKNFFVTLNGVLFEGEKYLGTTEKSFEVISITIWTKHPNRLKGLDKDDFYHIEREVLIRYPKAEIQWKSPIKELLHH